jgi:hypothetical protein
MLSFPCSSSNFLTLFYLSLESACILKILLERHQLLFHILMTLLQSFTSIITRFLDEEMVLQHLLGHKLRQIALICRLVNLHKLRLLARHLGDLVEDLSRCVEALCAKDASAQNGGPVLDDGFDELACPTVSVCSGTIAWSSLTSIALNVDQGKLRVLTDGQREC